MQCVVYIVRKSSNLMYTSASMSAGLSHTYGQAQQAGRGPSSRNPGKGRSSVVYHTIGKGIAGSVAKTGVTVNVPDAFEGAVGVFLMEISRCVFSTVKPPTVHHSSLMGVELKRRPHPH